VSNTAQLRDVCLAAARLFGWDGKPSVTYYGDVNTVVVCDEKRRAELIEQRQRMLEAESEGKVIEVNGHEAKAAVTAALPVEEAQSGANVGTGNGTVAQDQSPVAQPDPLFRHMQSIGRAESWQTGNGTEPENHAGNFGPWPEEYE
jgi:hypothetical protein